MPLQTHCAPGGHGDTRSSARKVLSSFSVILRSYVRSAHDGELHVPVHRSSGEEDAVGTGSAAVAVVAAVPVGAVAGVSVVAGLGGDDVGPCGDVAPGGIPGSHATAAAASALAIANSRIIDKRTVPPRGVELTAG
jgi:hypothetical protein